MSGNSNKKPQDKAPARPTPESGIPLAEEVEDEMLDQDIPVETGVRPAGKDAGLGVKPNS